MPGRPGNLDFVIWLAHVIMGEWLVDQVGQSRRDAAASFVTSIRLGASVVGGGPYFTKRVVEVPLSLGGR